VSLLGIVLLVIGLLGLGGLIAHDALSWYQEGSAIYRKYIVQRALYVVGTTTDIPAIQSTLTGMALWIWARWASRRRREQLDESNPFMK
jgi:hypothetical protein